MKKTSIYNYNLPEREDKVQIDDLNQNTNNIEVDLAIMRSDVNTKAPIHSPQFSGEPKAPKPGGAADEYERIATVGTITDALEVEVL